MSEIKEAVLPVFNEKKNAAGRIEGDCDHLAQILEGKWMPGEIHEALIHLNNADTFDLCNITGIGRFEIVLR